MTELEMPIRGMPIHFFMQESGVGNPLVFLHGFSGDSRDWLELTNKLNLNRPWLAIDLLGHGKSGVIRDEMRFEMEDQIEVLDDLISVLLLKKVDLIGYSMGARVALAFSVAHPERISRLVLESGSPGIIDESGRKARRESDEDLAAKILRIGVPLFVEEWENNPLFSTQKKASDTLLQRQRLIRREQNELGLAGSLRGMGTGAQRPHWENLHQLPHSILLMTGKEDEKFTNIAISMRSRMRQAKHVVVENAGHNVHLEQPNQYLSIIQDFLKDGK